MEGSKVTLTHDFVESIPADLPTLEAKLSSRLRELCDRNSELSRRNLELRQSAELGWSAEVQIKRLSAVEADLSEKIQDLQFEGEVYLAAINEEKEKSAQLNIKISQLEQKLTQVEKAREAELEQTNARLARALKNEANLQDKLAEADAKHERALFELQNRQDVAKENEISLLKTQLETQLKDSQAEVAKLRSSAEEAKANFEKNYTLMRAQMDQALEDQESHFLAQLTDMTQNGLELESELQKVKQLSETEREQLVKTANELRRALHGERQIHAQVQAREAQAQAELDKLRSQAKADSVHSAQTLAAALEAKNSAEEKFESQKSAIAHMSTELNIKIREWREGQETIQKQMSVIGEQSRSAQDRSTEISALKAQLAAQSETLRDLDQEINRLTSCLKTQEEINQRQLTTLANMSRAEKEKDLEIQRYQFVESSLSESINELRRAGQERDDLHTEYEAHISRLNEELQKAQLLAKKDQEASEQQMLILNTQLQSDRSQLESSRSLVEELTGEQVYLREQLKKEREVALNQAESERVKSERLSTELQGNRAQLESLRLIVEDLKSDRDYLHEQLNEERAKAVALATIKENRADAERVELERLSAQLQQREFQLRHYAANVNEEKSEVLRRARLLADEIRAATTLAPLKDYLGLTEFELGKVEGQLRKTPTLSIERPRLEASWNQMVEQRDFLKAAIANSQRQLDQQAAQLLKIAKPEKLAPIPPLPPRST